MSHDELKHITPTLHKIAKNGNGFTVPDGYFKSLEIPKIDSGLSVPEGYFDTLESKVLDKVAIHHKKFGISKMLIAASFTLLLAFIGFKYFPKGNDIQYAEIENWIENGTIDINSYELASLYQEEIDNISFTDFISQEEIENYLNNDINTLYYIE
jgi:hypothetical protein